MLLWALKIESLSLTRYFILHCTKSTLNKRKIGRWRLLYRCQITKKEGKALLSITNVRHHHKSLVTFERHRQQEFTNDRPKKSLKWCLLTTFYYQKGSFKGFNRVYWVKVKVKFHYFWEKITNSNCIYDSKRC